MKLKKGVLLLSAGAFALFSFTTEVVDIYSVIRVAGSITHSNNKALFTGDKVRSNEHLKFKTEQSKAAVISNRKGRFILTSSNHNGKLGLMPAMNNVSSRSGALINALDLKKHFDGNYLVLSGYEVEISEKSFPMNEKNFFFLRFDYNGETISKKLSFDGKKLKMDKEEILQVDDQPIELPEETTMKLYYLNGETGKTAPVAEFVPIFADEEILKLELKIIMAEYHDKEDQKKFNEITAYLNENYGKPHKENLGKWMEDNFGLKDPTADEEDEEENESEDNDTNEEESQD